jgi:NAD(P)-dependent dehydrogenase (short-subunit alcohol dehydrogenase family)
METTAVPVAVVTGAAQGIGRKVAEALAGEGYALALTDLREPAETLKAVRGRGAEALTAVGDVTSPADVAALAEQVADSSAARACWSTTPASRCWRPLSRPRQCSGGGCWR